MWLFFLCLILETLSNPRRQRFVEHHVGQLFDDSRITAASWD